MQGEEIPPPKKNLSLFSEIKDLSMKQEQMLYKERSDNNLKC